jgi:endonuclease G
LVKEKLDGTADRSGLDFSADPDIPVGALPKSNVYSSSGYDKGHMAPAGDFKSSQTAMVQTFQFGNAVPQTPENNRHLWKALEETTREMANRRGELYVITGPIFSNLKRNKIKNSVSIPDSIYKILIDPEAKMMTGFVIPNIASLGRDFGEYQVSVRTIENLTGLDFNPKLNRSESDKLEAGGSNWLIPRTRVKNLDN